MTKSISKTGFSFALTFFLALLLAGIAQKSGESAERKVFAAANQARRAQGLMPLQWDSSLARAARQHAEVMARRNALSHQFTNEPSLPARASRAGAQFISISENIAQGPDAKNLSDQWMHSPQHRQNLLDPDMNAMGVGIARRGGALFAAEDFAKTRR